MKKHLLLLALLGFMHSCKQTTNEKNLEQKLSNTQKDQPKQGDDQAIGIIDKTIEAHGGKAYENAQIYFTFRDRDYAAIYSGDAYHFTVKGTDSLGNRYINTLENGGLSRKLNDQELNLNLEETTKFSNSLNSVIYFALLPYKLNDTAVIKGFKGITSIKNQNFDSVKITFVKQGGGGDHDDEYRYWINQETHLVDYLAYDYEINEGGVRFRSAYNRRSVGGILFQDYVNWEAPKGTPLDSLPQLYESGRLKELSRIENTKIRVVR